MHRQSNIRLLKFFLLLIFCLIFLISCGGSSKNSKNSNTHDQPGDKFVYVVPMDGDFYVAPDGDDNNDGRTPQTPPKND